jgi:hypothetical protein
MMSNGIRQLDLGAVFDTLARQKAVDAQIKGQQQQGQMNALQMARYQRESDTYDRQQNALARLNNPDRTDDETRNILAEAYPDLMAKAEATRLFPTALTGKDRYLESPEGVYDLAAPGGPKLIGGGVQYGSGTPSAPPASAPPSMPPTQTAATVPPQVPQTQTSGSGAMPPKSNNVGNIRTSAGNAWQGKVTPEGEAFEHFDSPENGVRATAKLLTNYARQGTNTLRGIVSKWAPPNENQTDALIVNAAKRAGFDPDQPLDLNDPAVLEKVTRAIILQEQGRIDLGDDVIRNGVRSSLRLPTDVRPGQAGQPATTIPDRSVDGNKHIIKLFGPDVGYQILGEENKNPNTLLSDVLPPEMIEANPHWQGLTIADGRKRVEAYIRQPQGDAQPQTTQPAPEQPQRTQTAPQAPQQASTPFSDDRYDYANRGGKYVYEKDGKVQARDKRTGQIVVVEPPSNAPASPFGNSAEARAVQVLIDSGLLTREQAAAWLVGKTATGPNGQVDILTPGKDGKAAVQGQPAQQPGTTQSQPQPGQQPTGQPAQQPTQPGQQPSGNPVNVQNVRPAQLSAQQQEAILESDKNVDAVSSALNSLTRALELNDKAFDGPTAGARAFADRIAPGEWGGTDTTEFQSLIENSALASLKAIFGGNPTEGERKILMDLQASVNKTAEERKVILDNAIAAAKSKLEREKARGKAMRDGTYYTQGIPDPQQPTDSGDHYDRYGLKRPGQ